MNKLLKEFGSLEQVESLYVSGWLTIRNESTALMSEYLELDIEPLRRNERFEDRWDERVMQLCVKLRQHKEKFVFTDMSVKHRIQPVHLFSSPDEKSAVQWLRSMVASYKGSQ